MSGLGHNRGPTMEPGVGWRTHCWTTARRELLPHLPIEIVRLRVARAKRIGLDYRTYATVRATSGHDIVAFLFSSNALHLVRPGNELPVDRVRKLGGVEGCAFTLLAYAPLDPKRLMADIDAAHGISFDAAGNAPPFTASWSDIRARVRNVLVPAKLPAGGVLVVGDTTAERDWAMAGHLAGYLTAERYFPADSA